MRARWLLALALTGCAPGARGWVETMPPSPVGPSASIVPSLALDPVDDDRPGGERRAYPSAPRELQGWFGEALAPWLAPADAPLRLRLRWLRLALPADGAPAGALIEATLRRGDGPPLWQARASGEAAAQGDDEAARRLAVQRAAGEAARALQARLGAALSLGHPALPSRPTRASPAVFLVERVGLDRESMEILYIEAATGAALRHEAGPLLDRAHARPGDWLLSRRTVEGLTLSGEAYEALARALAGRYDLRQLDDAYRYHFFGKK